MRLRANQTVAKGKIAELKDKAKVIIQNEKHSKENQKPKTKRRTNDCGKTSSN